MGNKIWVVGITLLLASKEWNPLNVPAVAVVGAVLAVIGAVMIVLDR
jgi:hypothetical protein